MFGENPTNEGLFGFFFSHKGNFVWLLGLMMHIIYEKNTFSTALARIVMPSKKKNKLIANLISIFQAFQENT